ncbi:MAG TPA: hypothetical protein DD757_13020 [Alcanivorax sp.]|nr:hypothetical protein [Alcanivorax sp.]HAB08489.1 hypothetical protein [Alcanivorax sp.]HAD65055.1 hypothetical protein [Alcanivorax sp.]HBP76755.1 hypothetical protein [Alcanivorax sp.]HCO63265.1 hypothetical protein [Alcanivorax sp.]
MVLLGAVWAGAVSATEKVYFAGFGYLGNSEDIAANYPYTLKLAPVRNGGPRSDLEVAVEQAVRTARPEGYHLITDKYGDLAEGETLSLALTLDSETVSVEPVCGEYKVVVDLAVQALVFDFETMAIIGSYPLTVQYIDVFESAPSKAEIANLVRQLYLGDLEVNVLDRFAALLNDVRIRRNYGNRIQVTDVSLGEKALTALPPRYRDRPDAFRAFVAQRLGSALSSEHGISVLPYTKGHAIGNKMSARFANSRVYTLSVPEPDYHIDLRVRGFKKVAFDERASGRSVVYGSFIGLKVYEPLSGKVFMDQRFKRGATRVIPACQLSASDWPAYQESLLGLFDELAHQITARERDWAKSHAGGTQALESLRNLKEVMERCE